LVKDGQKVDLIDGVIYMASPDSLETNNLFMWLGGLIEYLVGDVELREVFGSRAVFRLDNYNSPEPGLAFARASRLAKVKGGHLPKKLAILNEILAWQHGKPGQAA
jgi:Uma2 family endonuclease